jgi:4-coumarate--CoA ligase
MVHIANTTLPFFLGPWVGSKHIIMAKFDVEKFCRLVEKYRPLGVMLPRPMILGLISGELPKKYDFSSVKYLVSTGGRRQELTDKLLAVGDWSFIDLYGMTEAAPYIAWSKIGDRVPAGEIGSFVPNVEARLCDGDGKDVPLGASGELWLRGPNMTAGYVENPEANALAFKDDGTW